MNILYEDAALVVLDKPTGLSSEEGVPAALRQLWGQPDAFVGVVHRLGRQGHHQLCGQKTKGRLPRLAVEEIERAEHGPP